MRSTVNRCSTVRRQTAGSISPTRPTAATKLVELVHDEAGDAVVHDLGHRALPHRHDGRAAGHRLDHHQPERLRPGDGEEERVRVREQLALALVADLALVHDLVAVDVRLDLRLEVLAVRLLQHAGHDELAAQPLGRLDAVVEALGLADAAEGQQVVVLLGRVRPLLDGDGVVGEAGPAHAGRRHRALVLADADVADLAGELLVEAVGELVEGAVDGVDHRRRQVAAEGDAEEPGVVVHEVELALLDVGERERDLARVVGRHADPVGHLLREQGAELGRRVRVAGGVEAHVVAVGDEPVAELLDDPLRAAVAGGRDGDPGRCELGDAHGGIVEDARRRSDRSHATAGTCRWEAHTRCPARRRTGQSPCQT